MEPIRKLDKERMRQNNVRLIFEMIYRERGITRAQLAAKTKMSAMNVGRIVDTLLEQDLVAECEMAEPGALGRPGRKLVLRQDNILHLGVSLDVWGVYVGLVDPYGTIIARTHRRFDGEPLQPEQTLRTASELICRFVDDHALHPEVMGMVLPGLVDPSTGFLRLSSQLCWRDVPLADMMRAYTGLEVILDNDVKGRAQAESRCGASRKYDTSVLMTIGSGIGAGIILNGSIYRGKDNMAGEIGHIAMSTHSKLCECGQVGCLQATVTETAILQEAAAIRPGIDMAGVAAAYAAGEAWAHRLMGMVCGAILTTINLLANTYASEAIILCGRLIDNYPIFRQQITDAYEQQQPSFLNTNFDLGFSDFGPDGNVIGASTIALSHTIRKLAAAP